MKTLPPATLAVLLNLNVLLLGAEPPDKPQAASTNAVSVAKPAGDALQSRMQSVLQTSLMKGSENSAAGLIYMEAETRKLFKEFPQRPEPFELLMSAATFCDAEKARTLAHEIVDSKLADAEIKARAAGLLKNLDNVGKPLALKYSALDGRAVDLEQLKGKVVLVDFWATWCPPCIGMLPHLKATYQELKPRGFEILGISYDDDKQKLESFLKREQVSWPQFFDEKGRENKFAQEFSVQALPTMWLVDKKGVLRYLTAGNDLVQKVKTLLDE